MATRGVEHSPLYRRIRFGFTAHPITVWAGVILLRLYFEWVKQRAKNGEKLDALEQRNAIVLRLPKHSAIELEPRQLAIEVMLFFHFFLCGY